MDDIEKQRQTEELMTAIGEGINDVIEEQFGKMGFALIVFEFNSPGISNYVSNAKRGDMITALRETADRLEKNQDIPKAHTTIQQDSLKEK